MASLLMLDVEGAFDNVSHPRLIHNLRKRRIPQQTTKWIESFLSDRSTTIKMPEGESPTCDIATGIPQGSPISPYLFYNADIADLCSNKGHLAPTFIDDVSVLVRGPTAQADRETLKDLHADIQRWAGTHASQFGLEKYNLIHFWPQSRAVRKKPPGNDFSTSLDLNGHIVAPRLSAKLLGVILDSRLDWKAHLQYIEAKATSKLTGLSGCAGSAWGVPYEGLRNLYRAMILPNLLYACSVWYTAQAKEYTVRGNKINQLLRKIQKKAACVISGDFKNVGGASLDIGCHLLSVREALEEAIAEAALRLQTCLSSPTARTSTIPRTTRSYTMRRAI